MQLLKSRPQKRWEGKSAAAKPILRSRFKDCGARLARPLARKLPVRFRPAPAAALLRPNTTLVHLGRCAPVASRRYSSTGARSLVFLIGVSTRKLPRASSFGAPHAAVWFMCSGYGIRTWGEARPCCISTRAPKGHLVRKLTSAHMGIR